MNRTWEIIFRGTKNSRTTMKTKIQHYLFATLLFAAICLPACTEMTPEEAPTRCYSMTVQGSKGEPVTKALSFGDKSLVPTWTKDDKIKVSKKNDKGGYDVLKGELVALSSGATTTFSGKLELGEDQQLAEGDELMLEYLSPAYKEQDGTIKGIETTCDYAIAYTTVTSVDGKTGEIATADATFSSQQAIVKFKLVAKDGKALNVNQLSLSTATKGNDIVVKPVSATDELYVAIQMTDAGSLTLTAETDNEGTFTYVNTKVSFVNEKYYQVKVSMEQKLALGMLYYSDGSYGRNKHADKAEPIGVVAYLEKGHGLIMALHNSSDGVSWNDAYKSYKGQLSETEWVTTPQKALDNMGGSSKTAILAANNNQAAVSASKYSPAGTTGWFLPTSGEWLQVMGPDGLVEGYDPKDWNNGKGEPWLGDTGALTDVIRVVSGEDVLLSRINEALKKAGEGNYTPLQKGDYWTSSEKSKVEAIRFNIGSDKGYSHCKTHNKAKDNAFRVRPFLAF